MDFSNDYMSVDSYNISEKKIKSEKNDSSFNLEGVNIDLNSYASNFIGNNKICKLLYIAQHNKELKLEAYKLSLECIKETTYDIKKYLSILEKINVINSSNGLPEIPTDQSWIEKVKANIKIEQNSIEKLNNSTENCNADVKRENFRIMNKKQGDLLFKSGDYQNAVRFYLKNKDYNSCSQHMLEMYFDVIKIYFEQNDYLYLQTYISKAENIVTTINKKGFQNKIKCCSGLVALHQEKFRVVARLFSELVYDMDELVPEILSPNDIAIYGGLCALATFDRYELKNKIIDNGKFKQFLELEPQILEIILSFYNSKYTQMLEIMERIKPELLLDRSLRIHVNILYKVIRERALVQYFSPFQTVDMNKMAKSFNLPIASLQNELVELIAKDLIKARIDSQKKILYAKRSDQRNDIFEKTLKMGEKNRITVKNLLLRMKMEEAKIYVSSSSKDQTTSSSSSSPNVTNLIINSNNSFPMNLSPLDSSDL